MATSFFTNDTTWTEVVAPAGTIRTATIVLGSTAASRLQVAGSAPLDANNDGIVIYGGNPSVQITLDPGEGLYAKSIQRAGRVDVDLAASVDQNAFTGWADYLDTQHTSGAPWQPTPDQWTDYPHNSGTTIKTQMPSDVTDLFENSKISGRNGDGMFVTVEFLARPTTAAATFLRSAIFIGNNLGPLADGRIYSRPMSFPKGQGQIEPQTFTTGIFTLNTFEANGGALQFNPTAAIDIWSVRIVPHRTHKAR